MPYEYRQLTAQERAAVVRHRREAGFPPHAPPHPFREEAFYLITAANYEHVPIMLTPQRRTEFELRLLATLQDIGAETAAWIVLPNHYHALIGVDTLDVVSAGLKGLHGGTSREWNLADGLTGKRRVWFKFSDRMIRNETHFFRALNYIHYNAVKHRYVEDAYHWPWQSLGDYLDVHGREWLRAKWVAYPPGNMGKGWDD